MKSSFRRVGARVIGITALALLPVLGTTIAAHADTQTINYDIQASAVGQTSNSTLPVPLTTTAPATVASGGDVSDALATGSRSPCRAASTGYTLKQIQDIALEVPVPTNSTYVSATCPAAPTSG